MPLAHHQLIYSTICIPLHALVWQREGKREREGPVPSPRLCRSTEQSVLGLDGEEWMLIMHYVLLEERVMEMLS